MSYFDISAIGGNPYMMSPLGAYGLGTGGTYSSYGMPMMGMTGGLGMSGYPGMGMMGMYNPSFMGQMTQTMQDIEKMQLNHSGAMHRLISENRVDAYEVHDRELFEKSMVDSSVQGSIANLTTVIKSGDADAICQEYDKLKSQLYSKYADYFDKHPNLDPGVAIRKHIEDLYSAINGKKEGEVVSLQNDIKRYGETAFTHGFNKHYLNNNGYHDNYTEETLSYLYDTRIDSKGRKDKLEKIGGYVGRGAEVVTGAGAGYAVGLGATALAKTLIPMNACKNISLKGAHKFGKWAALAAVVADVLWQCSRD